MDAEGCPICTEPYCEPITLECCHTFCRLCILQSTRLSPDGRSCPLCRSHITIRDLALYPTNESIAAPCRTAIGEEAYAIRQEESWKKIEALCQQAERELPIFAMSPGTRVGAPVALHLFEPRYKILIRRAWEGNRLFVYCGTRPAEGARGTIVRVESARFLPDGRANIVGVGVRSIQLESTWVEDGTGGLWYTRSSDGALDAAAETTSRSGGASSAAVATAASYCACSIL